MKETGQIKESQVERYTRMAADGTQEIYISGKYGSKRVKVPSTITEQEQAKIEKEMVRSVTYGYKEKIGIKGVGYRAQVVASKLEISLGYKKPIVVEIPSTIKIKVKGGGMIIEGWSTSYSTLRQYLSTIVEIRSAAKDKYNGKGIMKLS